MFDVWTNQTQWNLSQQHTRWFYTWSPKQIPLLLDKVIVYTSCSDQLVSLQLLHVVLQFLLFIEVLIHSPMFTYKKQKNDKSPFCKLSSLSPVSTFYLATKSKLVPWVVNWIIAIIFQGSMPWTSWKFAPLKLTKPPIFLWSGVGMSVKPWCISWTFKPIPKIQYALLRASKVYMNGMSSFETHSEIFHVTYIQ